MSILGLIIVMSLAHGADAVALVCDWRAKPPTPMGLSSVHSGTCPGETAGRGQLCKSLKFLLMNEENAADSKC